MKTVEKRLEDNVPGKYYVTDACNGCGLCFSIALQNFMYSNDSLYYYVFQQPVDEREEADIREAISVCPTDCIKDDGLNIQPS
jgi:ferredoxin